MNADIDPHTALLGEWLNASRSTNGTWVPGDATMVHVVESEQTPGLWFVGQHLRVEGETEENPFRFFEVPPDEVVALVDDLMRSEPSGPPSVVLSMDAAEWHLREQYEISDSDSYMAVFVGHRHAILVQPFESRPDSWMVGLHRTSTVPEVDPVVLRMAVVSNDGLIVAMQEFHDKALEAEAEPPSETVVAIPGVVYARYVDGQVAKLAFTPHAGGAGYIGPSAHVLEGDYTLDVESTEGPFWRAVQGRLSDSQAHGPTGPVIGWEE